MAQMTRAPFSLTDAAGEPLSGWQLLDGPHDVGSEERWRLRLADGRVAMLARLSPALARDESVRRRWVRDVERVMACAAHSVAPVLAIGPQPDPRDTHAEPPWRLRVEPEGQPLTVWLARAPVSIDELAQRGAALADALHAVHLTGAVVRNLHPRDLVWTDDGRVILTDIGLARVDLLSSHTASSLLISGSAYAAPEQLMRTVVDQRADLYSLGVILWQAATGELPFGDGPALLREHVSLPPITSVRRDAPPILTLLLQRCLAERPEHRPDSAAEIAWVLRGGAGDGLVPIPQTVCQHCGASLRLGQRLCLSCGRVGVRFAHRRSKQASGWGLELSSLREDAKQLAELREFLAAVSSTPERVDEFVIGDVTLYADHELAARKRLPARLFNELDRATANELCARAQARGLDVRVVEPQLPGRWVGAAVGSAAILLAVAIMLSQLGMLGWAALVVLIGVTSTGAMLIKASSVADAGRMRPLHRLRDTPAALPASDPLVARLAALLDQAPADVRVQLGELALVVQRLVDRRAELTGLVEARELDMLTAPVEPLIGQIERRVAELVEIDRQLSELDEATMVRELAAVEARGDAPGLRDVERRRLLDGLDRLRGLEDRRTAGFHALLEAGVLLRRAVDLGLGVHDPVAEQERRIAMALASLGE